MTPTVRVRIAVAVDQYGAWNAAGFAGQTDRQAMVDAVIDVDEPAQVFWVEADLPIPQTETVEGTVSQ